MECGEYIEDYLAAYADGELSADEQRAADAHLASCAGCRVRLADERALKALLKSRVRKRALPPELRTAIEAALDRAETSPPRPGRARAMVLELGRAGALAPLIAIAAVMLLMVVTRGWKATHTPPSDFDLAVDEFSRSEKHFEPNVRSDSAPAVANQYYMSDMPSFIWNFSPFGFRLVGGRIDKLSDGRPATFTLYRGPRGAIMCIRFQVDKMRVPPGGAEIIPNQYAYSYKGCTLVLSVDPQPGRRWVCMLISRLPRPEFMREVSSLE